MIIWMFSRRDSNVGAFRSDRLRVVFGFRRPYGVIVLVPSESISVDVHTVPSESISVDVTVKHQWQLRGNPTQSRDIFVFSLISERSNFHFLKAFSVTSCTTWRNFSAVSFPHGRNPTLACKAPVELLNVPRYSRIPQILYNGIGYTGE
jgi:hypothetical protein